jgi:ferrous iron transport protein A
VPFTSGVNFTGSARPPSTLQQTWNAAADVQVDARYQPVPTGEQKEKENKHMETISLRKMKKGQAGAIAKVTVAGELGRRIREMGLIPETEIIISGRAPLNDPVAVRIMDCTPTLRNNEADYILVHV